MQLNSGQEWETNQPLRDGMERMQGPVSAAKSAGSASDLQALANGIQQQVEYLIANCELPTATDETLNVMTPDLLECGVVVTKKNNPQRSTTVMRKALEAYPMYFDHAGWSGLGDTQLILSCTAAKLRLPL